MVMPKELSNKLPNGMQLHNFSWEFLPLPLDRNITYNLFFHSNLSDKLGWRIVVRITERQDYA